MRPLLSYPFLPARYFKAAQRAGADVIVMHTMEAAETPRTAEAVAKYFSSAMLGADGKPRMASAHFCVDDDSIVQCVRLTDVAHGAPGANHNGIHVELAGFARQTGAEWQDPFSTATLRRAATLVAELCRECTIPVTRITAEGLRLGARGVCGHVDVSTAFKKSDHTDPGHSFPWLSFLDRVRQEFTGEELDALDRGEELVPSTERAQ